MMPIGRVRAQVLVAHGTRNDRGVALIGELARRVAGQSGAEVHVAFVDVLGPSPEDVLRGLTGPALVVPAFLSRGYHVRVDIPAQVAGSGHPDVTVTDALGPSPQLARMLADRLLDIGWRPGDSVVLGAAATSDLHAQSDLRRACALLSALLGERVEPAYAAGGDPTVADTVARLRGRGAQRVFVASYLLAHGVFHQALHDSGADGVTSPLGCHPAMPRLVTGRFRRTGCTLAA